MNIEKMLNGKIYDASDVTLAAMRIKAHRFCKDYNDTYEDEEERRAAILEELLPNRGEGTYLQGPIQFDYGVFTSFGMNCYANFNLTVLDCCPVHIVALGVCRTLRLHIFIQQGFLSAKVCPEPWT